MYHANEPNRARRAAEAAAQHSADVRELAAIRRCQRDNPSTGRWMDNPSYSSRDARADELKAKLFPTDSNESGGLGQAIAQQRLASCHNIAQRIADFIADMPVDLTAEPDENYPRYMERRDGRPMRSRVNALVQVARAAGFDAQDEARVRTADVAEVQTYEAAVYAALSTAGATPKPLPEQGDESWPVAPAAWGVR